jgi:hypothetical protein
VPRKVSKKCSESLNREEIAYITMMTRGANEILLDVGVVVCDAMRTLILQNSSVSQHAKPRAVLFHCILRTYDDYRRFGSTVPFPLFVNASTYTTATTIFVPLFP